MLMKGFQKVFEEYFEGEENNVYSNEGIQSIQELR